MAEMTKAKIEKIDRQLQKAFMEIAEKHGLNVKRGNIRYSESGFKYTGLEFNIISPDGLDAVESNQFKTYAPLHGIKASALGKTFNDSGDVLRLVGFKNRNRKDKFLLEDQNGNRFKATVAFVKNRVPSEYLIEY